MAEEGQCLGSSALDIVVSLERGAPALLLFSLMGDSGPRQLLQEINTRQHIFQITNTIQESLEVKLRAWNVFSSLDVDVEMHHLGSCATHFIPRSDGYGSGLLNFNQENGGPREEEVRVLRSVNKLGIKADSSEDSDPSEIKLRIKLRSSDSGDISLEIFQNGYLGDGDYEQEWSCTQPCTCQGPWPTLTHTITKACLPKPFEYYRYFLKVTMTNNDEVHRTGRCITYEPPQWPRTSVELRCTQGCMYPENHSTDINIQLICKQANNCPADLAWHIEDPRNSNNWDVQNIGSRTIQCYLNNGKRPLIERTDGASEYRVSRRMIDYAIRNRLNIRVVAYGKNDEGYTSLTIPTVNQNQAQTTPPRTIAPINPPNPPGVTSVNPDPLGVTSVTPAIPEIIVATPSRPPDVARTTTSYTPSPGGTTSITLTTTTDNISSFFCTLSPPNGTILDAFNITCTTKRPCSGCRYCFQTDEGQHIRCSNDRKMQSVFLPPGPAVSNYTLKIVATLINGSSTNTTYILTEVQGIEEDSESSSQKLQLVRQLVNDTVAQLLKQGLLSGESLGQMFRSVSDVLNSQSNEADKDARQEVREQMLGTIITVLEEVPIKSPQAVQVIARGLAGIIKKGSELSPSAQKDAASLVKNLSLCLRDLPHPLDPPLPHPLDPSLPPTSDPSLPSLPHPSDVENGKKEVHSASNAIVESASNILDYASDKSIGDDLLGAMSNIQSVLLRGTKVNEKAVVVHQALIDVFVKRVAPENLQTNFTIPDNASAGFSLPYLPSNIIPPDDHKPVDVKMLSLKKNPFSWSESGNISGVVGALSLTREDGSSIRVENLAEDIEIFLPRSLGMEVNNSVLDLRNYSTMKINITSSDTSLVLKMEPSVDPLPLKLYLGHGDYPTDTKYVAMTEMPHQGETQEEKYTWLLDAKDLKGNTGEHYLVVRPIVGPGIKSVNASLNIASIATQCKYWDESKMDWSTDGCRVGIRTTHQATQCLCNHLTTFGSSFFVTPNPIDLSRTAELFGTFAENPVVVCFVGALFLAYFLVVVWARRKDMQDTAKVKVTVLEDNNPMDEYGYMLTISTGLRRGASTSSQVTVTLQGVDGESEPHHLTDPEKPVFERGDVDTFLLTTPFSLGDLQGIRLWHDNSGAHPSWYVSRIMVQDLQTEQKWTFLCNSWLGIDIGDCVLDRIFPVATEIDLKKFSNLFFMKTTKDFSDSHLWFSVISRPPGSPFTCVQRVSCCFSLLLCTMLTSIMFSGIPTDPSEQTMDLGTENSAVKPGDMLGFSSEIVVAKKCLTLRFVRRQLPHIYHFGGP